MKLPTFSLGDFAIHGIDVEIVEGVEPDFVHVQVEMRVNAVDGSGVIKVKTQARWYRPAVLKNPIEVLTPVVQRCIVDGLKHEMDEWLTVDGERVATPHKDEP